MLDQMVINLVLTKWPATHLHLIFTFSIILAQLTEQIKDLGLCNDYIIFNKNLEDNIVPHSCKQDMAIGY